MGILSFARRHGEPAGIFARDGRELVRKLRWWRLMAASGVLMCAALVANPASADPLRDGIRAYLAHDYVTAARIFTDLAPHGNPVAQTYLGYMYANGKGVPQDFVVSAGWYSCASQQGVAEAQYELGLMYDKAQGVPQDYVAAYALVNLAVAKAGPQREPWARVRDAIASKLSLAERTKAQQLSFAGLPETPCLPMSTGIQLLPWPTVPFDLLPQ
jgi:hypothetical protein